MVMNKDDVRTMLRVVAQTCEAEPVGSGRCARMLEALARMTEAWLAFNLRVQHIQQQGLRLESVCVWGLEAYGPVCRGGGRAVVANGPVWMTSLLPALRFVYPVMTKMRSMGGLGESAMARDWSGPVPILCSFQPAKESESTWVLGIMRHERLPPFTDREVQILELLHGEVNRICHEAAPREHAMEALLPPYLRKIVPELLAGRVEKQIAANLGFSFDTMHQYIREIYRRTGVSSRAEFMARWLARGPAECEQPNKKHVGAGEMQGPSATAGDSGELIPEQVLAEA